MKVKIDEATMNNDLMDWMDKKEFDLFSNQFWKMINSHNEFISNAGMLVKRLKSVDSDDAKIYKNALKKLYLRSDKDIEDFFKETGLRDYMTSKEAKNRK